MVGWALSLVVGVAAIVIVGKFIENLLKFQNVHSQKTQAKQFLRGEGGLEIKETAVTGKTYLCLVNPYSGMKKGVELFEEVTKPMFLKGGVREVVCVITQRAGHFGDLGGRIAKGMRVMKREKEGGVFLGEEREEWEREGGKGEEGVTWEVLERLDGVLIFGGDGSLFEFLNGVVGELTGGSFDLSEEDVKDILNKLVVGILPCGTGNGIAASYGARSVVEGCRKIVTGRKLSVKERELSTNPNVLTNVSGYDVCQVTYFDEVEKKMKRLIDVHYVSWGFAVQHDDLVEREFRSLGNLKMLLAPVICIGQKKTYEGTISILPSLPHTPHKSSSYLDPSGLPDSTEEGEEGWKVLEGPFVAVSVGTLSWAAHDMCVSDDLAFDDGDLVLLVVPGNISRIQMTKNFIAAAEVDGLQKAPLTYLYSVKAVKMKAKEVGPFGASGENINNAKRVEVSVCPSLCRFLKD